MPSFIAAVNLVFSALEVFNRRTGYRLVLRWLDLLALAGFVFFLQDHSTDFYLICLYVLLIAAESPGQAWPLSAAAVAAGSQAAASLVESGGGALLTQSFVLRVAFVSISAILLGFLAREAERERQAGRAARLELSARIADLREFLDNILQSIQTGVLVVDAEGLVELCNRRAAEILGVRSDQLVDRPLGSTPWLAPLQRELEAQRDGAPVRAEVALRTPAGAPIELGMGLSPLSGAAGRSHGTVIVFQDITPIKDFQRRLMRQERLAAAGQIAGSVAHEFGNLLGGLRSHAEFALRDGRPEELRKALEVVARNIDRALLIVRNLLSFSRPAPPRVEPCELAGLLDETLVLLERDFRGQRIAVERRLAGGLAVSGDPGQLRQVFLNILLNARQAMPAGGTLRIEAGRDGDGARIDVADTGPGIPAEVLPRIFEPFFTTKTGEDGHPPGSGLGLAISRDIVAKHGGTIEVANGPAGGALFRIRFPRVLRDPPTADRDPASVDRHASPSAS